MMNFLAVFILFWSRLFVGQIGRLGSKISLYMTPSWCIHWTALLKYTWSAPPNARPSDWLHNLSIGLRKSGDRCFLISSNPTNDRTHYLTRRTSRRLLQDLSWIYTFQLIGRSTKVLLSALDLHTCHKWRVFSLKYHLSNTVIEYIKGLRSLTEGMVGLVFIRMFEGWVGL